MRAKKMYLLLAAILLLSCISARAQEPFRLHIIANSDGTADQKVKLLVRDAILEDTADQTTACRDKQQAEHYMREHLSELEACANQVLAENGFGYTAQAYLGRFEFPDKTYGDVTYPAGEYDALRLVLGQGEGQNWWCVMFPPLCIVNEEILEQEEVEYTSLAWEWLQSLFGGGKKEANHAKTVS